jgi:4-amino-4-deoxy-L-arabinose transferase-like glycosyltransferase
METSSQTEAERIVRQVRGFIALVGGFLVIIGQMVLYTTPKRQDTGIPDFLWMSLVGVALIVLSLAFRPPRLFLKLFANLPMNGRFAWIATAAGLSVLATASLGRFAKMADLSYLPVFSLWLLGGACYVTAFTKTSFQNMKWKEWLCSHQGELLVVGVVTLLALLLRLYKLGSIPQVINGDEGMLGMVAQHTIIDPLNNPFALWNNDGALYLQAINTVFTILGPTDFALRLLPAIAGIFSVPALYLLARQLVGKRTAFIAAALLAFSHFDLNFSRTSGGDYIFTTLFVPLILYFLIAGFERKSFGRAAFAGVLLAFYFTVYQVGLVVVGLAVVFAIATLLFFRRWLKVFGRQVLTFWGGFVVLAIPEVFYIWKNPDQFFARLASSGTFQSGWLAQTTAHTGQPALLVLAERVPHAFLSLIYYPSIAFYGVDVPPLTMVTAAFFLIGVGVCLWRARDQNYLILNAYFWGFTIAAGIFAIPPSADSYRMLIALPAALLMAAIGLDQFLGAVGVGWGKSRLAYTGFTTLILISLLATNLWTYFGAFAGGCLYADDEVGRFASYMGSFARTVRPEDTIYLLSDNIYRDGTHASTDFQSGGHPIINVPGPVDSISVKAGEAIIANPNRFDELQAWALSHPEGQLHYTYDCTNLIMMVYQFP